MVFENPRLFQESTKCHEKFGTFGADCSGILEEIGLNVKKDLNI
jgi:hypothetical protein